MGSINLPEPKGGELAPPDTGAAGAENENADGAAGPNQRKASTSSDEGETKPAKKATKKK